MANIEALQKKVGEVKTDLDALKKESSEFKSQQEKLSDEIKKQRETLLNQKKEAIEIKRQEAEKMLIDIKLEQLDKAQLEKILESEEELKKLGLELERLKQETWYGKLGNWVKEKGSNVVVYVKENPGKSILFATGIGYLLYRILRKKKKNEEGNEGEGKEKKSRWKKALTWAGIGVGGTLVWKNRDKINDWFGGLFGGGKKPPEGGGTTDDVKNSPQEFKEKLSDKEKQVYNNFSNDINEFYKNGAGAFNGELLNEPLGASNFEIYEGEKISGLVPFMLNNRYKNIDSFLSEGTFYREAVGTETDAVIQKIKGRSADQIGAFLIPIASTVDAMTPGFLSALINLKTTKKVEDFITYIKGNPDAQEVIRLAFRKTMMVMSYFNSKESGLKYKLAYDRLLKDDSSFKNKSIDDQNEIIADHLKDEEFYKRYISSVVQKFRESPLYEGINLLEINGCLDAKLDPLTQEAVDDVEKRRKDLIAQEAGGDNKIEGIKSHFESGKLSAEGQNDLEKLVNDFEEEIDDAGRKSWYNKYLPLMNFFDPSDDIMQKLMNGGDYDNVVKVYKDKILGIKNKLKDGTLQSGDVDDFKSQIDGYSTFQKSVVMSQTNIEEVFDKNGNKILRWGSVIWQSGKALWNGVEMLFDKKWIEGGLVTAGALVSLDIITYPLRFGVGLLRGHIASSPSSKLVFNLGKFTLKRGAMLAGKSFELALRNYMPIRISSLMYKDKDYLLRYEAASGNLSLDKAYRIAKKNKIRGRISGNTIASEEEFLRWVCGFGNSESDMKKVNLLRKYWNNKYIRKQVIECEYSGKWYKMVGRKQEYRYGIKASFEKLQHIDAHLSVFASPGTKEAAFWESFMQNVKTLDRVEEFMKNKKMMGLLIDVGNTSADYLRFSQLLAKNFHKFTSLNELEGYLNFLKANKPHITNVNTFFGNSIAKWNKIKLMSQAEQVKYIESAKLNASGYEKTAFKVKNGVNNMIKDLNGMLKNPKMKSFYNGIKSKISNLTEYSKTVTPESIKAAQEASWLDKITGFGKLTPEGILQLKNLNGLLYADEKLLQSLSKANKLEDVKNILTEAGVDASKIDEGVLMKLAGTKNVNNIKSIVNYGAEIDSINVLRKIFQSPAMKALGRYLVVVGAITDFAFVGIDFVSETSEATRIKQYNLARGENKESEAYYDVVVGSTGALAGLGAGLAVFGLVSNPVGWVCLGATGVAYGAKELGDLYYGEIDKFKQNYKDFLSQNMPAIKQRLIYINSWQTGLDSSFQDLWSKVTGNLAEEEKKKISVKTSADAVKALIYFEEFQKYPYAAADLNAAEVRNNSELKALVEQQKSLHDKSVEIRYAYIKKNYIDGKTSIVSKEVIDKAQGIQALDNILAESRMCQAVESDVNYTNKADVKGYPKYLESELKKFNSDGFVKLEKMYASNRVHFFQTVASLPYYENILNGTDIDDKDKIVANLDFFKKYVNCKLMNVAVSGYPTVTVNKDTIDYDEITRFLSGGMLTATALTVTEIPSAHVEYMTDNQVNEKYNVSSNLGQNVLYDIAHDKLGYLGKNDLNELKKFYSENDKETKGIYFDGTYWAVNENNGSDNEFAKDLELNNKDKILQLRHYVWDAAHSVTTGNMIAGNDSANKEFAQNFVNVINKNLEYRVDSLKYKKQILDYIKSNSNGTYIQLLPDLIIAGIKSGINNVAAFVYNWDGKKFDAKTINTGLVSELLK